MKIKVKIACLLALALLFAGGCVAYVAAEDGKDKITVNDIIDQLELSKLESYYEGVLSDYKVGDSVSELIEKTASGESVINFSDISKLIITMFKDKILSFLPFIITLISLCIILSMLSGVCADGVSGAMQSAVDFAGNLIIASLVLCQTYYLILEISAFFEQLSQLSEVVFPILLTIMSTVGATNTVSIFSPSVAIFTGSIIGACTKFILPAVIISLAVAIVGSLSSSLQLNNLHKLITDFASGLLKTMFFVFLTVLSIQGVVTGVSDGMSQRLSKFALSKYVPVIGGYLSDGINYFIAGSIVVKNAIGITSIILLLIQLLPILLGIIAIKLSLKAVCAIAEPIGLSKTCNMLSKTEKSMSLASGAVCGLTFAYVIFTALIMLIGNTVI